MSKVVIDLTKIRPYFWIPEVQAYVMSEAFIKTTEKPPSSNKKGEL